MKKVILIALLLATVISVTLTGVLYKDAVQTMIDIGKDTFNAWINGEEPNGDDPTSGAILKVKSIELDTTGVKTSFAFAEEFSSEGLKVIATMSDGSTKEIDLKDCRIVAPSMTTAGESNVRVFYENIEAKYKITIAARIIPAISATPLVNINEENATNAYRVEAEAIDMTNVTKASGVNSFVASAEAASSGKYLTGYNVPYNYFGFTFTAAKDYENVTIVVRVQTSSQMLVGDVMKMYLNYNDGEGNISLKGYSVEACADGEWKDLVIRGVNIPAGTNTLTFDMISNTAFSMDYVDFYVGKMYLNSNSTIELTEGSKVVKDVETLDVEKAFTRQDVADAHGLLPGQLRIETPGKKETYGKPTNNGTSVAAIGQGSQITTILSVDQNATVLIKIRASKTHKGITEYYIADNWKFYIDGVQLQLVERKNIVGGNLSAGMYWDWLYTEIGAYNLSAGDHLFMIEATGDDCNIDTFEFEVISYGEYASSGADLNDQHPCESPCSNCGKCTDADCEYPQCLDKCTGNCENDIYITNGSDSYRVEAEDLSTENLKGDKVGVTIEERPHASGLGHIADGGYQTLTVKSEKNVTVALSISFANSGGGSILKYIPKITVNGTEIEIIDSEVPKGIGTAASNYDAYYWNLAILKLGEFELEAGVEYEIRIYANMGNLDAYMLDVVAHQHIITVVGEVSATCIDAGTKAHYKCDGCGKLFSDAEGNTEIAAPEVIPATGHTFDQQIVDSKYIASKATCTASATYYESCKCGEKGSETFDDGEALGHSYDAVWTSDENGHWHVCANGCGVRADEAEHIPNIDNATETDSKVCNICDYVIQQALGHTTHNYTIAQRDETHHWNKCYGCNAIDAKVEHTYSETVVTPATCNGTGVKKLECSCGYNYTESIDATGHTEETVKGTDATCTDNGLTDGVKCSVCGTTIEAQEVITAPGHSYDNDQDIDCNSCGETRTVKLPTPDNSEGKLFYMTTDGKYVEIDRSGVSFFTTGTDHVIFYVYTSADADKNDYVARFTMTGSRDTATTSSENLTFVSADGQYSAMIVKGYNTNYYIVKNDYNTFYNFLRDMIGYDYSYGQTYYFAVQSVAAEGGNYISSDISAIGANGLTRDASVGTDKYTVTVANGLIDAELTTVNAGYGVELTLSTEAQDGKFFKGWYLTDAEGNEIGEALSVDLTYTVTVTGSASYKAVFASEKTKLATIDNTNNEMINFVKSGSTFYIEFDRHKDEGGNADTVYDAGVDYVRYYMYRDFEGEKQLVSWFDVTKDGYLIDYNGNKNSQQLLGGTGNFYSKFRNGTWHEAIKASYAQGAAANGLTVTWDDSNVVYFACQARTESIDSYEHGEIGTMGKAWGSI